MLPRRQPVFRDNESRLLLHASRFPLSCEHTKLPLTIRDIVNFSPPKDSSTKEIWPFSLKQYQSS
jgi:hypothetical protein